MDLLHTENREVFEGSSGAEWKSLEHIEFVIINAIWNLEVM